MRAVIQKVSQASVQINGEIVGRIKKGYMVLVGVMQGDAEEQAKKLADKIVKLRLFEGEEGKMNDRSLLDVGGEILVISQFTLAGDVSEGNRPDYTQAAKPEEAEKLYDFFCSCLRDQRVTKVATGKFRTFMSVSLVNEGPVTLMIDV